MEGTILQDNANSFMDDYLLQKKFELMLNINNKKIAAELGNMQSMINKLNEEISEIKKNFNENAQRPKAEYASSPVTNSAANRNDAQSDFNRPKNNEQAVKPRYGDYTPKDVAIDKFFYFGNKKIK